MGVASGPYLPKLIDSPSNQHDRERNNGDTHDAGQVWVDPFSRRLSEGPWGGPKQD